MHTLRLESIRRQVLQVFAELKMEHEDWSESLMVRDGHYCGRRFRVPAGSAVWFLEESQIKIYNADGKLICVRTATEEPQRVLRAA